MSCPGARPPPGHLEVSSDFPPVPGIAVRAILEGRFIDPRLLTAAALRKLPAAASASDWSKAATALATAGPISDQDWWEAFLAMMGVLAQSSQCVVALPKLIAYALHLHRSAMRTARWREYDRDFRLRTSLVSDPLMVWQRAGASASFHALVVAPSLMGAAALAPAAFAPAVAPAGAPRLAPALPAARTRQPSAGTVGLIKECWKWNKDSCPKDPCSRGVQVLSGQSHASQLPATY